MIDGVRLQTFASSPVLELRDVTYRRDGKEIIRGVSFTVNQGERWAMLGPNGAGKSTILGFCGAVTHPTSGTVHVLGSQLGRVELQALRRMIGHVNPRHPLRSPLTVRDIVLTGLTGTIETTLRWQPTAAESAAGRRAHLLARPRPRRPAQRWPVLSQGERGRVLIARALICEPRLCCSTSRPPASTSPPANSCSRPSTCSPRPTPTSPPCLVTHHLEELPSSALHALLLADGRVVPPDRPQPPSPPRTCRPRSIHPIDVQFYDGRWLARAARRTTLPSS